MGGILLVALGAGGAAAAGPQVEILDRSFDTAANMLAYTEFELSGEPLAERLGLDLDALNPDHVDQPTVFDYAAGIESYEYSEEAMYALDYQSRLGVHLANGPVNAARGGSLEALGKRFLELTQAAGFPADELPLNLYPLSLPYSAGEPELAGAVDTRAIRRDTVQVRRGNDAPRPLAVEIPAYFRDFKTLAWKQPVAPSLTPGAIGGALLKETMWAQDFLGGMHTRAGDEEVDAASASLDQAGKHALGVSSVDGVNGLILTELAWDKLWTLQERLAYDGQALGAKFGPGYDPIRKAIWFPEEIRVTPVQRNGVNALGALAVVRRGSSLRDTWLLLWAASEFYAFSDGRAQNASRSPAFQAVFDGSPFPRPPAASAHDPFSLAANVSELLYKNLAQLHFDPAIGSFVDHWDRKRGTSITTYDAAYTIVALAVFQRAMDALPVGYASGDNAAKGLATPQGKKALELIRRQARFIVDKLVSKQGLVADGYAIDSGPTSGQSLDAQFAAIRGLAAAFVATGDARFRNAARRIYLAVERERFDPAIGTYAAARGTPTEHTPWTAGAVSGGLRALLLHLANDDAESTPELAPAHLTRRYTDWFRGVINGGAGRSGGMQLAEWIGDSGENVLRATGGVDAAPPDSDGDGVPQVTGAGGEHGTAMTLAGRVRVSARATASPAADPSAGASQ